MAEAEGESDDEDSEVHFSIQKNGSDEEQPISLQSVRRRKRQHIRLEFQSNFQAGHVPPRAELYSSMRTIDPINYQSGFRPHPGHASLEQDGGSHLWSTIGHGSDVPFTSRPIDFPREEVPLSEEEASPKGSPEQKLEEFVPGTPLQPTRPVFRSRTYQQEDIDKNTYTGRLASLYVNRWNVDFMDKRMLARAGFYYLGFSDEVICSKCHSSLKQWEPGDDPWIEHYRNFGRSCFPKP